MSESKIHLETNNSSANKSDGFDAAELKRSVENGEIFNISNDSKTTKPVNNPTSYQTSSRLNASQRHYLRPSDNQNRNNKAAKDAAETDPYELKEMMARGAESVLYRAVSGAFTYCAKSIRNGWSKVLGSQGANNGKAKLENVSYKTKVRHILNEYDVSQRLVGDGVIPVVRVFALRKVKSFGVEVGYDLLMEYLQGHDLSDKILAKILPLEDKVRVMYQAAQALSYVHMKKIIHLDIKPSNFMLIDGKIKLIDFGVSVANGHHSRAITGTGGYLSPEQICRDTMDERTDLFAFGVTFACFFGAKPLVQPQDELLTKQAKQEAIYNMDHTEEPAVREVPMLQDLPELADCIRQCTIMRRDKRMSSTHVLLGLIRERAEKYNITL